MFGLKTLHRARNPAKPGFQIKGRSKRRNKSKSKSRRKSKSKSKSRSRSKSKRTKKMEFASPKKWTGGPAEAEEKNGHLHQASS